MKNTIDLRFEYDENLDKEIFNNQWVKRERIK